MAGWNTVSDSLEVMDEDHLSDITSSFVESLFMDNLDDECIDTTNADSEEISDFYRYL